MVFAGERSHARIGRRASRLGPLNTRRAQRGAKELDARGAHIFIRTLGVDLKTPDRSLCLVG